MQMIQEKPLDKEESIVAWEQENLEEYENTSNNSLFVCYHWIFFLLNEEK